jgi:A/G-specific adenine glycosylase
MPKASTTLAKPPQIKPSDLHRFHAALSGWYQAHGRHHLPWRQTSDPYHIWVSEVMLQQTQVATVLERFYFPFLKTFPTIQSLAIAPREKVLKAWEGLGYYRRAGFLHEAAKRAHNGLPDDVEALIDLPGIGRNTAHAVLSFAHHQPLPILEANVKRIVARIFALTVPTEQQLWDGSYALFDATQPFNYNQSLMDLGSMICTPKAPLCEQCPAAIICKGKAAPELYPTPKVKKKTPTREQYMLVLQDAAGKLHLEARSDALLGGLYGFPQVPRTTDLRYPMREMQVENWGEIGSIAHVYSHFKLDGRVIHGQLARKMTGKDWYSREEIQALPLSKADHKVLALMDKHHTPPKKR